MASFGSRLEAANYTARDGTETDKLASHAINSDLEDMTPAGSSAPSGNSTPLSDYSPHSQPFAERPKNRTTAGVAARQGMSALPSPPPFTPAVAAQAGTPPMSAAGSNDMHKPWRPGAAADTPGVMSAWQPANASPGSSSVTFAFTPPGEASSPDAQPFAHAEQASGGQQTPAAAAMVPKPSDLVRSADRKLHGSHDCDAMSDASGSVASTNSTTRSYGSSLPASSPGDLLRAVNSKLSSQHAISGSSRIHNPRRKSGALQTPMHKGIAPAPTPHSTPLEAKEVLQPDDLDGQGDATAESAHPMAVLSAGAVAGVGSEQDSLALPPAPGSLKVAVQGSPPTASPTKSTKSPPGSRSSVVSIGSVCGAAAFTPLHGSGTPGAGQQPEGSRFTPTCRLNFDGTPGAATAAAGSPAPGFIPGSAMSQAAAGSPAVSPAPSFDIGEAVIPARSPVAMSPGKLPDDFTGMVDKMQYSGNKAVLRGALEMQDAVRLDDQFQAALADADEDAVAALGLSPAAVGSSGADAAASGGSRFNGSRSRYESGSWLSRYGNVVLLLLAGVFLVACSLVAVQLLPPTMLPPGMVCTPDNAEACRAVLAAQLRAAEKEPNVWQLVLLKAKWYVQDAATILWTRHLPEGVTVDHFNSAWLKHISSKQLEQMTHEQAMLVLSPVPEHMQTPAIKAKLQAAAAHQAAVEAAAAEKEARLAAERAEAERIAAEKAEAERMAAEKAAEEARLAAERAEAERLAAEKAEAERIAALRAAEEARLAAERAEAERIAAEKAEAERLAREKAEAERLAAELAEAERIAAEKAEAERIAAELAEAERLATERAEAERIAAEAAEAEGLAAERAAEEARLAAEAAEAQRLAAEQAAAAARDEAERAAHEEAERAAAGARAAEDTLLAKTSAAGWSWWPLGLFVLLCLGGGGSYMWWLQSRQQAAALAVRQQQLLDIQSNFDEAEGQAYQQLDEDEHLELQQGDAAAAEEQLELETDMQPQPAATATAVVGAAAGALAAGMQGAAAVAARIMTPRAKAPRNLKSIVEDDGRDGQFGAGGSDAEDEGAAAAVGRGSSGAAAAAEAAAATPRNTTRRGSRSAAAGSGADSDAPPSTGRGRGRGKRAAATPAAALQPLLEDAPAEHAPDEGAAAAAANYDEGAEEEAAPARRGPRRQSAPAASRRRSSTAAAAEPEAGAAAEAATPTVRRSTRAARTPRV